MTRSSTRGAPSAAVYREPLRTPYEACPLCGGPLVVFRDQDWSWRHDYQAALNPVIRWMACERCGHQCTWGPLTTQGTEVVLSTTQAGQTIAAVTSSQVESARFIWCKVVDAVARFQPDGHWLDVGAGSGMLLGLARECGYEVTGSDLCASRPSRHCAPAASARSAASSQTSAPPGPANST